MTGGPISTGRARTSAPGSSKARQALRVKRRPSYGRRSVDLMIVMLVIGIFYAGMTNPNFQWDVVAQYLTHGAILRGLVTTLQLTVIAMLLGTGVGILIALLMLSEEPGPRAFAASYKWLLRGTPLLVQLIFWFNISALYPNIALTLPGGYELFSFSGNAITPFMAAVLGLALHESAYMAEIIRGGVLAVGTGQQEAATALGMRKMQAFFRIVLPQALRVIVPATGNQVILMLKTTSLVSVIALPELLYSAQTIYARTFQIIPLLLVASIWYLAVCSLLSIGQFLLEKRLGQGYRR